MPLRLLLLALALALTTVAADSPDAAQIRGAAVSVTRDPNLQSQLPDGSGVEAPEAPHSGGGFPDGGGSIAIPAPAAVFSLLQWVVIAIALIAVVALVVILFGERVDPAIRRSASMGVPVPEAEPTPADPRGLLARADELAAAGRYAEAMHLVLLAAMATIGVTHTEKLPDSLTSWEVLRTAPLRAPQVAPLRDLVTNVERAWFGKRPAEAGDYRQVRGNFDAFAAAREAQ